MVEVLLCVVAGRGPASGNSSLQGAERRAEVPAMRRSLLLTAAILSTAVLGACQPPPPPVVRALVPTTPTPPATAVGRAGPVMAASRVTASEMAAWYSASTSATPRSTVSVEVLAQLFLDEGAAEGVTGDVAFVQTMIETGWLRFPDGGQVRAEYNNFAGIGAVDGGSASGPARFPDARTGVRAQIQHLRVYADPAVTPQNLAHPLESPRFHLVRPRGKAPSWSVFGNGNWATDPGYAAKIERLYSRLLDFAITSR